MGRPPEHELAIPGRGIAGAHRHADLGHQQARRHRRVRDLRQRLLQVFLDVVAEGLQGRDIQDLGSVFQLTRERLLEQAIEAGQEGGQRLREFLAVAAVIPGVGIERVPDAL